MPFVEASIFGVPGLAAEDALTVARKGEYALASTVDIKYMIANTSAVFASNAATAFSVRSGANIHGGKYISTGGVLFHAAAGAQKVAISGIETENTSASNATAIHINESAVDDTRIVNNHIQADGFAILTNSSATVDGLVIAANIVDSDRSDAVEINAPGVIHKNIAVVGNVLAVRGGDTGHTSGFAVGVAAGKCMAVVGNAVKECRNEAFHFEDAQHTNTVVGNVGQELQGAGHWAQPWDGGVSEGMPVVGNSFRAASGNTATPGYWQVWDTPGSVEGMTYIGNRAKNFYRGFELGKAFSIVDGNVVEDASDSAIYAAGGSRQFGTNLARNCATLAKTERFSVLGKIVSATTPTTLLDTSAHTASTLGSLLRGFAFPKTAVSIAASSTTTVDLFPMPLRMRGRLVCAIRGSSSTTHFCYFSADLIYDGTTLTVSNTLEQVSGNLNTGTFVVNSGNLAITVANASTLISTDIYVDFDGEYLK